MELANVAVVVSDEAWEFFDMADETTGIGDAAETLVKDAAADAGAAKQSATDKLKEEASKFGSQAADRARAFAGDGKEKASGALDEVARMMHGAADDVDAKLGEQYGKYARTAADGISNFAESLRGKDVDDLLADATDFVKKSPVIAVGTAAALGFVMARLIKSGIDASTSSGGTAKPDA